MNIRKAAAILAATALAPVTVVAAEIGPAAAACNGPGNYFVGASTQYHTGTHGVLAKIAVPAATPSVSCDNGFTDVWDMAKGNSGNPANDYAQIGFGVDYLTAGGGTVTPRRIGFTQWTGDNGVPHTTVFAAPAASTTHTYVELYTAGHMEMRLDGATKATTSYDPTVEWPSAWQGEFYNELAYPTSQAWGSSSDKVLYHNLQKHEDGVWEDFQNWDTYGPSSDSSNWSVDDYTADDSKLGLKTWNN